MNKAQQTAIQAKVFDFALTELVRNHRDSFQPLWTIDSWAKFMIWLTLNSGLSGDKENLELFAKALGSPLTNRLRRIFFERKLEDLSLYVMADPAENNAFLVPFSEQTDISCQDAAKALELVRLNEVVSNEQSLWKKDMGIISIPWKSSEIES